MPRVPTVLAVVLALAVVGCGGGGGGGGSAESKAQYGKDLARTGETLQKTFSDIADQTSNSTSPNQIGARLSRGARALDQAAGDFQHIKPPPDAQSAHRKLVDGLHQLAGVFRRGADAARRNDTKTLTQALQGLATSDGVKKITEAQQELKAKGITITTPSGG